MRKRMSYEHLDSGESMHVQFELVEEDGHWTARLHPDAEDAGELRAPTFYGATMEQAERQLRKVFEKDYELVGEAVLTE